MELSFLVEQFVDRCTNKGGVVWIVVNGEENIIAHWRYVRGQKFVETDFIIVKDWSLAGVGGEAAKVMDKKDN